MAGVTLEKAIWYPFWYELDQSIEVGSVEEFAFFRQPPDHLIGDGVPVFFFGDWNDKRLYYSTRKRLLSLRHRQLGAIKKIEARGLDYTFTLSDGRVLKVEAEESPGLVYDFPEPIEDWRVRVDMEPA